MVSRARDRSAWIAGINGSTNFRREATGRVNENRLPAPGWLVTQISPPWRLTNSLQMSSPMPSPFRPDSDAPGTW